MMRPPTEGVNHLPSAMVNAGRMRPKRSLQPRGVPRKAVVAADAWRNQLVVQGEETNTPLR